MGCCESRSRVVKFSEYEIPPEEKNIVQKKPEVNDTDIEKYAVYYRERRESEEGCPKLIIEEKLRHKKNVSFNKYVL